MGNLGIPVLASHHAKEKAEERRRQEATKKNEMRTEDYADCHLYAHSQWMEQQF